MINRDKIEGGVWGLLVGDALGVPYEFHAASDLPAEDRIEMIPPDGFVRAHSGVPPATFSDDGAQALCLLASLLDKGRLVPDDFASKLVAWYDHGYCAVDGNVFDCGVQTGDAIRALKRGVSALDAGASREGANGNGSLMRVLPLALWHQGSDAELVSDAHTQSRVTHGHPRAQVCCALYCLWARYTVEELPDAWVEAVSSLRAMYQRQEPFLAELEMHVRPDDPPVGQGSGYVVDTLRSARQAALERSYEKVVRAAIGLGQDTDTTACVAGGIAGIRDGVRAIPERWLSALRGKDIVEPLIGRLVAALST